MENQLNFDKFMDDLEKTQNEIARVSAELAALEEENFNRKIAVLYRELPQNRIVHRGK